MEKVLDFFLKVIPYLQEYPNWIRFLAIGWLFYGVVVIAAIIIVPKEVPPPPQVGMWPVTGDSGIDKVHKELNQLEGQKITETDLIPILHKLFYRPVYYHINEESPQSALFAFYRTEKLLSYYSPYFTQTPSTRQAINSAIPNLIYLRDIVAEHVYGLPFRNNIQDYCEQNGENKQIFIDKLPPRKGEISSEAYKQKANKVLGLLGNKLIMAGLKDEP